MRASPVKRVFPQKDGLRQHSPSRFLSDPKNGLALVGRVRTPIALPLVSQSTARRCVRVISQRTALLSDLQWLFSVMNDQRGCTGLAKRWARVGKTPRLRWGKGQRRLRGMGGMPRGEPPLSSATKQAMYQDPPDGSATRGRLVRVRLVPQDGERAIDLFRQHDACEPVGQSQLR